jgi:hypothetical protein
MADTIIQWRVTKMTENRLVAVDNIGDKWRRSLGYGSFYITSVTIPCSPGLAIEDVNVLCP